MFIKLSSFTYVLMLLFLGFIPVLSQNTTKQFDEKEDISDKQIINDLFYGIDRSQYTEKPITTTKKKKVQVFGWYPHWSGGVYRDVQYKQLTTLSYFAAKAKMDQDFNITYEANKWSALSTKQLIALADADSCNVLLALQFEDADVLQAIMVDESEQYFCTEFLIDQITAVQNVEGVNIIFDHTSPTNSRDGITTYLTELSKELKKLRKSLVVTFPATAYPEKFDFKALDPLVDQFILSGFNYYYKDSPKPGPVAPLASGEKWGRRNLKNTLADYLKLGMNRNKLVMVLPYFGSVWEIKGKKSQFIKKQPYCEVMKALNGATPLYDTVAFTAYYHYLENGKSYVCYFDDEKTLKHKLNYLANQGVGGIGMWALGYDQGRPELSTMLSDQFKVIKNLNFENEVAPDTVSAGANDTMDLELREQLFALNEIDVSLLYSQKEIVVVFLGTLLSFILLGVLIACFSPLVYERILILSLETYVKTVAVFLLFLLLCFMVANYIFENSASSIINNWIVNVGVIGFFMISFLSLSVIFKFNRDLP